MDKLIKSLVIFSAILWLAACPAPPTNITHMGVPPGEHVVLECVGGATDGCGTAKWDFVRNLPDGTRASGYFRIPEGKMLVITDVDWQYHYEEHAYKMMILRLKLINIAEFSAPGPEPHGERVFESTIILNQFGEGGISESMTSGFVVSSKARICPDLFPGPGGPPHGLQHLILRGYLIPE